MNYTFDVSHAVTYGVDEAILLSNLIFWLRKNKANKKHEHEGRTWTYNSVKAFEELFPFWSIGQVRRILKSLTDQNVILIGNFNKVKYDQTRWYAVVDEQLLHLSESTNGIVGTNKPIPDSKPDNKPDSNSVLVPNTTDGSGASPKPKPAPVKTRKRKVKKTVEVAPQTKCSADILLENFYNQAKDGGSPMRRLNRLQMRKQIIDVIKSGIPVSDIARAIEYLFSDANSDQGQYMVRIFKSEQFTPDKVNQLMMKVEDIAMKKPKTVAGVEGAGKRI